MALPSFDTTGRSSKWSFRQLGGPRKTLDLPGRYGPQGRPRRGTVVNDGVRVALEDTYYSGDTPPTRNEFGLRFEPWELNGRWSDRFLGAGAALAKKREVMKFIADRQPVLISWGDIKCATGYLEELKTPTEGRTEIPWTLTIRIDWDADVTNALKPVPDERQPTDFTRAIFQALNKDLPRLTKVPPVMKGSVADLVDSLLNPVNSLGKSLNLCAEQVDSLVKAPFSALRALRASIGQFRTALVKLHTTFDDLEWNLALESERADDVQQFLGVKASFSAGCHEAFAKLAEMERQASVAQWGRISKLYEARQGDTWESIALTETGSSEKAQAIRDANNIQAGQPPIAGVTYIIPK